MIYVTHDQVEAMTMADKIVVLNSGIVEQVGTPLELYKKPKNIFVAGFIGSPKMNFLSGREAKNLNANTIGVRPEHLTISKSKGDWAGKVGLSENLGSDTFFYVFCEKLGKTLTVRSNGEMSLAYGTSVFITPDKNHIHLFDEKGVSLL